LVGPFVERIRALPESRTVFHLTGPDDYLVHVAVADMTDLQRWSSTGSRPGAKWPAWRPG
jgi:DNA-binding Lrp family transcriptional regulator